MPKSADNNSHSDSQLATNKHNYEVREFTVAGLRFIAKYWASQNAKNRNIIALHGWLDNCASFDGLATCLDANVLCLDLAGHGRSDGRAHLGAYNIWLDIPEVLNIADQLQWQTFEVMGHSRGAAIAFLMACLYPKRVSRFIGLDGIFPLLAAEAKAPEQLFHSINSIKKHIARPRNYYPTWQAAVAAREQGMFKLDVTDAESLAIWGVHETEQGFYWRYDSKVSAPSEMRFTLGQLHAFIERLQVPTHLFLATEGIIKTNLALVKILEQYSRWKITELPGKHHFHMSKQSHKIAAMVNGYE